MENLFRQVNRSPFGGVDLNVFITLANGEILPSRIVGIQKFVPHRTADVARRRYEHGRVLVHRFRNLRVGWHRTAGPSVHAGGQCHADYAACRRDCRCGNW